MHFVRTIGPIRFEDFSPADFERLVFAYHLRMWVWRRISWLGLGGSDGGRDIYGATTRGKRVAILCANYRRLTDKKVQDDVRKVLKRGERPHLIRPLCQGSCRMTLAA